MATRRKLTTRHLVAISLVTTGASLGLIECAFRLAGYPRRLFMPPLVPGVRIICTWGVIPYLVETNSLGLRGPEMSVKKPAGVFRIAALGDSVTEGYYVDNSNTYPCLLEQRLRSQGFNVEVANAGTGGCSIDREYEVLRTIVALFDPDLVLLTVVPNDIPDIKGRSREELLDPARRRRRAWYRGASDWLMMNTASGEGVVDLALRVRYRKYRVSEQGARSFGPERYIIEGSYDHLRNSRTFCEAFKETDGTVLVDDFDEQTKELTANYFFVLDHLVRYCKSRDLPLAIVYFPCHPQVYDPSISLKVRDLVQAECSKLALSFLDLTPAFKRVGPAQAIYLAPKDFHPSPQGNRLMAATIAQFLVERGLVK